MGKIGRPRKLPLEVEAKQFLEDRGKGAPSQRDIYVAAALTALLTKSNGQPDQIRMEAEAWADYMLKDS